MLDRSVEWGDKLKTLANEMMETFQKQRLTCQEVEILIMNISVRLSETKQYATEKEPFKALPF